MANLAYYKLAEAFFKFESIAEKENFYVDEVHRMAASLREMSPIPEDPKVIIDSLRGGGDNESI